MSDFRHRASCGPRHTHPVDPPPRWRDQTGNRPARADGAVAPRGRPPSTRDRGRGRRAGGPRGPDATPAGGANRDTGHLAIGGPRVVPVRKAVVHRALRRAGRPGLGGKASWSTTRWAPANRPGTPDQIDRFPRDLGVKAPRQLFHPPFGAAASWVVLAVLLGVCHVLYDRGVRPGGLRNRGSSCSSFRPREGPQRGLSPWWQQCCSLWSRRCSSPLGRRR